jgi:hypothetical protein
MHLLQLYLSVPITGIKPKISINIIKYLLINNKSSPPKKKMSSLLLLFLGIPSLFIIYIIYMFFIKIYLDASKFRRMDPTLKTFISPFSGIQGVQKMNL